MLHDLLLHEFCVAWLGLICFEDLCCPGSFRILVQRIDLYSLLEPGLLLATGIRSMSNICLTENDVI